MTAEIIGPKNVETIGNYPNIEKYESYYYGSKMMELSFFENDDRFELYIEADKTKEKYSGETSTLFTQIVKKIKEKANSLGRPVKLQIDPIKSNIKDWAETKASDIVGGWDKIEGPDRNMFEKIFYPDNL